MLNTTPSRATPWAGYGSALLATVLWSGNFIAARGLSQDIAPVTLAFYRWFTATIVLLPFALPGLIRQRREIRAHLGHLIPTSLMGITVFNTMLYMAAHHTTTLNLSLFAVFTPVFIVLLAWIFLGERVSGWRFVGVLLAVTGVIILATGGELARLAAFEFNSGDALMFAASLIFAIYTIMLRQRPTIIAPTTYLATTFILGLLMLVPWVLLEWTCTPPEIPSVHVIGAVLYIGVCASLLAFMFWSRAVAAIGPSRAGMIYYSLPFFCALEAWLILGEDVTWSHGLCGVMIITGIYLASKQSEAR